MTLSEQVEEVGFAGVKAVPTVAAGIGLGILVSIVPVILMAAVSYTHLRAHET